MKDKFGLEGSSPIRSWINQEGEVVHPHAPAGGGGPGHFRPAGPLRSGTDFIIDAPVLVLHDTITVPAPGPSKARLATGLAHSGAVPHPHSPVGKHHRVSKSHKKKLRRRVQHPAPPPNLEFGPILVFEKGPEYSEFDLKHTRIFDPVVTQGRLHGNSRRAGDADLETQNAVVKLLVRSAQERSLTAHDAAIIVAIARLESGFNPDAAAGTTSAAGLGQFVRKTGEKFGLTDDNTFDAAANAKALVSLYLENKKHAEKKGYKGAALDEMIYKYHHDGWEKDYGGLALSRKHVMPEVPQIEALIVQYLNRPKETPKPK
jgi:hypothetical protein